MQRNIVYRGFRYLKKKLNIAKADDYIHINTDWTHDCDVLVIIGGDVFDLIPSQKGKKYNNERIRISKMVKEKEGKVILWGISVGSFESDFKAKKVLIDYFKNIVDFAVIRDEKSFNYLKSNGVVNNIYLFSDPAYMLRTMQRETKELKEKTIGVNLSPLANRYLTYEKNDDEWIDTWSNVIQEIYRSLNVDNIVLIPHVVNFSCPNDDDYSYLNKLFIKLKKLGVPASLVDDNAGFIGVKKHLVKCDMILAARMHCAVNAITCAVPTVFLAYSPKSIGMCQHVYGNSDFVIDMNDLISDTSKTVEKLNSLFQHIDNIHKYLRTKNIELYKNACKAASAIENFLRVIHE